MTKIFNTFGFEPKIDIAGVKLVNAEHRGFVKVDINGHYAGGDEEILNQIAENPKKTFLVNRMIFDTTCFRNICKWDDEKKEADNSCYYGLIYA